MFMAAKQQTPGSTNTGKIIDHIDVNKAALSYESCLLSDLTHFFDLLLFLFFLLTETSQLLLIVSDGRGLFLEGKERVGAAVQAARSANIFVIFVVLDNPNSRVRNLIGSTGFCVHNAGLAKQKKKKRFSICFDIILISKMKCTLKILSDPQVYFYFFTLGNYFAFLNL